MTDDQASYSDQASYGDQRKILLFCARRRRARLSPARSAGAGNPLSQGACPRGLSDRGRAAKRSWPRGLSVINCAKRSDFLFLYIKILAVLLILIYKDKKKKAEREKEQDDR